MPSSSVSRISPPDSARELEYHFLLAKDLSFLSDNEYKKPDQSTIEVKRMLAGLIK